MIQRKQNIVKKISQFLKFDEITEWSKVTSPRGFSGITLYDVGTFLMAELKKDSLTTRANSVSFSLFLSIFPAIIFLFTLLPLFPVVQDYSLMMSDQLKGVIPQNAHDYIFSIINDITSIKRDGLLSIGAVLALLFSSNGMLSLMAGFDKAYK
ncbi:MAG: YhjD/YihY/BrkB family envelope integrity protein, partial [Saprospiraceae bacterium]